MDTAFHSPIDIDAKPAFDTSVSRYEQEEEGSILGAARWLVVCALFTLVAAGSALWM